MRNLASVQRITDIRPIEGADQIEVADILGWHVVVKKGEFKIGDLCYYFEVDSLLPMIPQFEFLADRGTKTVIGDDQKEHTGYRLRTIKLKGQISQGLALPLNSILLDCDREHREGDDVTKKIGVIKYENVTVVRNTPSTRRPVVFPKWLPIKLGFFIKKLFPNLAVKMWGKNSKPFPSFIPKTDETRLQAVPKVLERHKDKPFYVTEKIDGSSITVFCKDGVVWVCSRNICYPRDPSNKFWKPIIECGLDEKLKSPMFSGLALQGELVGPSTQGNKLLLTKDDVYFFNVFDIASGKYVDGFEFEQIIRSLGCKTVPIVDTEFTLLDTVDEMVTYATRKSVINPNVWAEGVVFRPLKECNDPELGRLSFKTINPEFLLKYKELKK